MGIFAILHRDIFDDIALYLSAILIGFLVCYLVQFRGWNYQIIPFCAYLFILAVWLAAKLRAALGSAEILLAICVLLTLGNQISRGPYKSGLLAYFEPYITEHGTPILVLSSNVSAAFPFVNEVEGRWTSRYPAQWLIPGALNASRDAGCPNESQRCADIGAVIATARSTAVEDFLIGQPEWVFVDERRQKSYFGDIAFNYIDFFSEDPRFSEQWRHYERIADTAGYSVWHHQP